MHPSRPCSAELRTLLGCARVQLTDAERRDLVDLSAAGLDYAALARAAQAHGLTPLLARHLHAELADRCPADVLARVRTAARAHVATSFAFAAELLELLAALRAAAIPALAIKGPVSALLCYGDLGLRTFSDLDLLIAPEHVASAARVLEARGYAPHLPLATGLLERLVRSDSELLFRHADGRRLCDLHWGLLPRCYSFSPEDAGVFAQRRSLRIGAADVPTLGTAPTLLFLLLHGMKHDWASLGWLCDVAELLRREPELDWDAVLGWSAPAGRRRFVDIGLRLAYLLLDAPVPEVALRRGEADPRVVSFAEALARALLRDDAPEPATSLLANSIGLAYFRAMELPGDRLRFLHDVVLRPTLHEWRAVPLPAALAPLHYLVRPLRLLLKHAPRAIRRRV